MSNIIKSKCLKCKYIVHTGGDSAASSISCKKHHAEIWNMGIGCNAFRNREEKHV